MCRMSLRCVGFIPQVVHRGGAAEEDGLEGRSGCRPSCEEESSPTADGYARGFTPALQLLLKRRASQHFWSGPVICCFICSSVSSWQMEVAEFTPVCCPPLDQRTHRWERRVRPVWFTLRCPGWRQKMLSHTHNTVCAAGQQRLGLWSRTVTNDQLLLLLLNSGVLERSRKCPSQQEVFTRLI